jgi:hypothetical protein
MGRDSQTFSWVRRAIVRDVGQALVDYRQSHVSGSEQWGHQEGTQGSSLTVEQFQACMQELKGTVGHVGSCVRMSWPGDCMFPSPYQIGRLPYCYTTVRREVITAAKAAQVRPPRNACDAAYLSVLAGCGRCQGNGTAKADAPHRHPDDTERVRRCRHT